MVVEVGWLVVGVGWLVVGVGWDVLSASMEGSSVEAVLHACWLELVAWWLSRLGRLIDLAGRESVGKVD